MNIILFSEKDRKGESFVFEQGDERYSHITKVLKLKTGDSFKAGIINSELGMAHIKEMKKDKIIFDFVANARPSPLHPLHLILGIPRPIQLKRLLKDVATMGVSSIHLVGTVLGEKSYITSSLIANNEIGKHLIEGVAQAGSTLIPSHHIYSSLYVALEQNAILGKNELKAHNVRRLLFDVENANAKETLPLDSVFAKDEEFVLAIGSERGWVKSERELFKKQSFSTVTLGNRIMRCETATIAAISYVLSKLGWNA